MARRAVGVMLNSAVTLLGLLLVGLVMAQLESPAAPGAEAAMMLGFVLLGSLLAGSLAAGARLPRVTGYVLFGMIVGPFGLAILTGETARDLRTIDELALGLIALTAGGELRLATLRRMLRAIVSISGAVMLFAIVAMLLLVIVARPFTPLLAAMPLPVALCMGLLLGIWSANSSPDMTVAVINDVRARGPLTDTVLSVTIFKDVLVIISFAAALSVTAVVAMPEQTLDVALIGRIAWEVGGALAIGGLGGWGFSLYLERQPRRKALGTLLFTYVMILVAHALHLELLLTLVGAGFVIENFSRAGDDLIHGIEANGLAVFALFFAIAGAALELSALAEYWLIALVVVGVRLTATYWGVRLGARHAGAPQVVSDYAWMGFISQAGVTLGLSLLVGRELPGYGATFVSVTAAVIIVHMLFGPLLLKHALSRSGEAGAALGAERGSPVAPDTAGRA